VTTVAAWRDAAYPEGVNPDVVSAIPADAHWRVSVEDYHRMIDAGVLTKRDRVELIEGVIVDMSPQSREHVHAVARLLRLLYGALEEREWAVRGQAPLTLARSEPEPDVAVVRQDLVVRAAPGHPSTASLVVEVARSSLNIDRAMAAVYDEAGTDEYWIVDVTGHAVEIHRDPQGGVYRHSEIARGDVVVRPVSLPGPDVEIATLFVPT
jgi:Uma2 family endonuclease